MPDRTLPPGGFYQYNRIPDAAGFENGYVKVERVSGPAPFYAYGVINDNFNSDGSFVFLVRAHSQAAKRGLSRQPLPYDPCPPLSIPEEEILSPFPAWPCGSRPGAR